MGIQNLYKLLKEEAGGAIRTIPIGELDGWRVGIDASMAIYQWCSVGSVRKIVNAHGKFINHIQGAFFRTLNMILAGIVPVYVFDGKPPEIKGATITARKELRNVGKSTRVPREVFTEVMKLLDLMGIVVLQAPSEAEAQAAVLTNNDSIDAVATEDMDSITFGARFMIRGLDTAAKNVVVIETAHVLRELKLTRAQFIDLCILLGCDYTKTIPGIGYKRAFAHIRKYGSIESILVGESIKPPEGFDYIAARNEFLHPKVDQIVINPDPKKLTRDQLIALREFLITTHGLDHVRVAKSLKSIAAHHRIDW